MTVQGWPYMFNIAEKFRLRMVYLLKGVDG